MALLANLMFFLLATIAATHVLWAFGVRWPAESERDLVALVVGTTGRTKMPGLLECLAAAAAIFFAGIIALMLGHPVALPAAVWPLVGAVASLVFLVRGGAAYLSIWRRRFAQEPFATMDRRWYGPLCLLLSAGFVVLTVGRLAD